MKQNPVYGYPVAHSPGSGDVPALTATPLHSSQPHATLVLRIPCTVLNEMAEASGGRPAGNHMVLTFLAQNDGVPKRWHPGVRGGLTPPQSSRATDFMAVHFAEDFSLADVARECGLSRGYFTRAFKMTTGVTPHQWRQQFRVEKAKTMLLETATPIAEIAIVCGFADQSHFTRVFSRILGRGPAHWRKCHRGDDFL